MEKVSNVILLATLRFLKTLFKDVSLPNIFPLRAITVGSKFFCRLAAISHKKSMKQRKRTVSEQSAKSVKSEKAAEDEQTKEEEDEEEKKKLQEEFSFSRVMAMNKPEILYIICKF